MDADSQKMDLEDELSDSFIDDSDADFDADSAEEAEDLRLKRERYATDTRQRISLAWAVVAIISIWLLFIMLILCLNTSRFHLSDVVLVTLLGTSTATVLGLPAIVLRGFFQFMNQTTELGHRYKEKKKK